MVKTVFRPSEHICQLWFPRWLDDSLDEWLHSRYGRILSCLNVSSSKEIGYMCLFMVVQKVIVMLHPAKNQFQFHERHLSKAPLTLWDYQRGSLNLNDLLANSFLKVYLSDAAFSQRLLLSTSLLLRHCFETHL